MNNLEDLIDQQLAQIVRDLAASFEESFSEDTFVAAALAALFVKHIGMKRDNPSEPLEMSFSFKDSSNWKIILQKVDENENR